MHCDVLHKKKSNKNKVIYKPAADRCHHNTYLHHDFLEIDYKVLPTVRDPQVPPPKRLQLVSTSSCVFLASYLNVVR